MDAPKDAERPNVPDVETREIEYVENLLAAGDVDRALEEARALARIVEEWASETCSDTSERQWFSFDDPFERLAYRRVENDPREIVWIAAPIDRLYAALAYAHIQRKEWESARDALMQAVRWNPMNCTYRLDLAELFGMLKDIQEWAALSASVLPRASDGASLKRAWANLGAFFVQSDELVCAEGCRRMVRSLGAVADDPRARSLEQTLATEHPELAEVEDAEAFGALEDQGISTEPNVELAVCLLMCATDASAAGDRNEATKLTLRARDLVGAPACEALVQLIRESDAELGEDAVATGRDDAGSAVNDSSSFPSPKERA